MKIQDLLTDKSKWTKNAEARNKQGLPVDAKDKTAVQWCLVGAVNKCYKTENKREKVLSKLRNELTRYWVSSWNDSCHRKFSEVKKLIKKLDI